MLLANVRGNAKTGFQSTKGKGVPGGKTRIVRHQQPIDATVFGFPNVAEQHVAVGHIDVPTTATEQKDMTAFHHHPKRATTGPWCVGGDHFPLFPKTRLVAHALKRGTAPDRVLFALYFGAILFASPNIVVKITVPVPASVCPTFLTVPRPKTTKHVHS